MQGKEYAAGTYEVPGKGMVIGEGMPRVLVSASGASAQEILASAGMLAETPGIDGIELRLDRLGTGRNSDEILALAQLVNDCWDAVGGKLLVVTVRTRAEGGDAELSRPEYLRLVGSLPRLARMDFIDIELRAAALEEIRRAVDSAHGAGAGVILSHHNFRATPETGEMVRILMQESAAGADVCKLAVMPRCAEDVARLLAATARARAAAIGPLLTISMGALGAVSRVSGGIFGSALTFAMAGCASAPGQLDVGTVLAAQRAFGAPRRQS